MRQIYFIQALLLQLVCISTQLMASTPDSITPPSSSYSVLPSAIGVAGGELRLTSIDLLANTVEYGISDHFSVRAMFELFNPLFADEAPTLSVIPKASFALSDQLHIAADFIYISAFDDGQLMIPHGVVTVGTDEKNLSIGAGYVFDQLYGASASYLGFSLGGITPLSHKWSLVTDNWILLNGDVNVGNPFNFLSVSARTTLRNKYHLDLGVFYNTDGDDFGQAPWPIIKLTTTIDQLKGRSPQRTIGAKIPMVRPPVIDEEDHQSEKPDRDQQRDVSSASGVSQAIYAELLGTAGFYSINYDRRFKASEKNNGLGIRAGVGYFDNIWYVPVQLNYLIGKNHFLELGIGTRFATAEFDFGNGRYSGFNTSLVGSTKYRYQSKNKHFFLSAGLDVFITGEPFNRSSPVWPSAALGFAF